MKKVLALIACAAIALSIVGCSGESKSEETDESAAQNGAPITLDEEVTSGSLTMRYPSDWSLKEANGVGYYIYPECGGLVYLQTSTLNSAFSSESSESDLRQLFKEYFNGLEASDDGTYKVGDFSLFQAGDAPSALANLDCEVQGQRFAGKISVSVTGHDLYGVMAAIPPDSEQRYFSAIDSMLGSISVTAEEVAEPQAEEPAANAEEPAELATPAPTYKSAGNYLVGNTLPGGEYMFVSTSGSGYACAWNGTDRSDILENENFEGTFILTVSDGMLLEVGRAKFVLFDEYPHVLENTKTQGMWKIGVDMPAGTYQLTISPGEDHAYWCVYNSSDPGHDIVNNNNFESTDYVDVYDGQYLLLSNCSATLM